MKAITGKELHKACLQGAHQVMENRLILNRINVFPVRDGDTGNNLASMMKVIVRDSKEKSTVQATFASISDAALKGARGNSGIIFAQYLNGLTMEIGEAAVLTPYLYAQASSRAVKYAYEAIEVPMEGTIITVMKAWGQALMEVIDSHTDFIQSMLMAYDILEEALKETQFQLKDLRRAGVVDSGAKGFVCFVNGMLNYLTGESANHREQDQVAHHELEIEIPHDHPENITFRYCTEGFIEGTDIDRISIRKELAYLGNSLVIAGSADKCRIHIHTDRPDKVFEVLFRYGTITFHKAEDMIRQHQVVTGRRADIAIVTDTVADITESFIDEHQIHRIHLNILFKEINFIDKLTIRPEKLLEYAEGASSLPTSSQPDSKQIEDLLNYLTVYYKSIIVLSVSQALSGTYANVKRVAKSFQKRGCKISVINTRQNSGAQGLLVKKAVQLAEKDTPHEKIVAIIEKAIDRTKILVRVKDLEPMIKSGRLSSRVGRIGRLFGLKPIVSLDGYGQGMLSDIAFSDKGSQKKLITALMKVNKHREIESYCIVYVDNYDEANELGQKLTAIIGEEPSYICQSSSSIAIGAGKGAIAVAYSLGKD